MHFFERNQWLFLIIAIFIGLFAGQEKAVADVAAGFILPLLMVMLFGVFLQTPFESLKKGFINFRVAGLSLAINFLWTPLMALGLSWLFFRDSPDVFIALIMDLVTPCTDWYLLFTAIAGGHLALSTALLPWNLLLHTYSYACLPFSFCRYCRGNRTIYFSAKFFSGFCWDLL